MLVPGFNCLYVIFPSVPVKILVPNVVFVKSTWKLIGSLETAPLKFDIVTFGVRALPWGSSKYVLSSIIASSTKTSFEIILARSPGVEVSSSNIPKLLCHLILISLHLASRDFKGTLGLTPFGS